MMDFRVSRRVAVLGAVAGLARFTQSDSEDDFTAGLPDGLTVRDYRLFPTKDAMRFLVEVSNDTDSLVDTPSIGVILPHLGEEGNFGWATPFLDVIHPQSSAGLIGVAPRHLMSDDSWGNPDWLLCEPVTTEKPERVQEYQVEITHTIHTVAKGDFYADIQITNRGIELPTTLTVKGLVRDRSRRIAGGTLPIYVNSVAPGTTKVLQVRFGPSTDYISNPVTLIGDEDECTADFSLQPWPVSINPGCSPAMPWNRS